ncbi:hypothetical protein [Sulfurivermis fontis]|uniref:hypothetical protein n=1 Tax=Sulfurivermis fontis TaxID=1972068 RepID=UPI000FD89040|nr:hypothetical protein [Sulfurivermis fontis]
MIVENQKKSKGDDSRNFRMTAKLVVIVLYTLLSSLLLSSEAFALTQVASPGSCSSTGSGDDNWSNPDRARVSDNNRADTRLDDWQDSELLECTDFGFSIPVAATIDGISVRIERRAQVDNRMRDRDLQLIKGGTTVGSNYADTTTWFPTSDTYASYGGAADLWGTTWTPAEINAGNFGVGLRVRKDTNSGGNTRAYVDHVEITIHYTDSAVSAALLAAYQFDEFSWDGSPGEVVDSSGNGNDGTSIGGATTIEPGRLCRAGIFDGSNYVQVSNLSSLLGNTATLSGSSPYRVGSLPC